MTRSCRPIPDPRRPHDSAPIAIITDPTAPAPNRGEGWTHPRQGTRLRLRLADLLVFRRRPDLGHLTVTVATRRRCGCCHTALDLLDDPRRRYGFAIAAVDVDSDPALVEQFGASVPVVVIGGRVRFRGAVNPVLLERLLRAESGVTTSRRP